MSKLYCTHWRITAHIDLSSENNYIEEQQTYRIISSKLRNWLGESEGTSVLQFSLTSSRSYISVFPRFLFLKYLFFWFGFNSQCLSYLLLCNHNIRKAYLYIHFGLMCIYKSFWFTLMQFREKHANIWVEDKYHPQSFLLSLVLTQGISNCLFLLKKKSNLNNMLLVT